MLLQGAAYLLPDPFRHQVVYFTFSNHGLHQAHGFRAHPEALGQKAGGEAGRAQYSQRVFGEGIGDVAQHALADIPGTVKGIKQFTGFVHGHGIDGQIPPQQVLLQRYIRSAVDSEAVIATTLLALGAGQGVFLTGIRVQENRKVGTYLAESPVQHLLGGGTDHYPVPVLYRQPE